MIVLIQQAALLIGTLCGAATDARTGYIFDWITYPMIAVGAVTSIVLGQWMNIGVGATIFVLMLLAYKFGKIGGGDVKIFTGIALLNPFNDINFLITAGFFAAASSMVFYSVFYTIKYLRVGFSWKENQASAKKALMLLAVLVIYFAWLSIMGMAGAAFVILVGVPFCFGLLFVALQESIKKNFFEKKITLAQVEDDEIIAEGRNDKKVLKLLKGKQLVGEREVRLLKKNGIRFIYVMRDLPRFGPFIFIGVMTALVQPALLSSALLLH